MDSIQNSLRNLVSRKDFQKRYNELKQIVLKNPDVQAFLKERGQQIDDKMIHRSLGKLYEFVNQSKNCHQCPSLDECKNLIKGYHPSLVIQGKTIDVKYDKCPKKEVYDARRKQEALIKSMYMPKDILHAQLDDISLDEPSRLKLVSLAQDFIEQYSKEKRLKGLYIYGPFGIGKTFVLGAIANELAEKGVSSMLVYVPEFMRELKSAIQDHSLNEKLEAVKKVPILMLDDIGAESMSSWMRDDILGTILQFRMLENLPTFFTSNFNFDELKYHLTYSQRGEMEELKALRIMERIKYLATPVQLKGKNRRM
ncbi:primosomal protein DnaI [Bacillus alveayuensis]|uniref:primosomal protein DnaI n=1 Tax=Aeribacillus alveayuensis TaxID=279215 RepID=UPI0005D0F055|nr:primosomal protein DnaI [Bacillus alveayuensis]